MGFLIIGSGNGPGSKNPAYKARLIENKVVQFDSFGVMSKDNTELYIFGNETMNYLTIP